MLVLDDARIVQVHPKGVTHPTKALLDVVGQFSRLIEKNKAQTRSEWAEYRCPSSLDIVGCSALAMARKRIAILEPVI